MERLKTIYSLLHSHFHPQHWWPVTAEGKLHPEYSGGPKNEKQQLEVCFGAILTQNTSWKNVEKAIVELNKHNLINIKKIIKNEKLAQIIKSSGYHNQKAKKLKNFCNFLLKNYDGSLKNLFNNNIEKLRNELLSINGIGPETADSIILYAAKKPIFVIDAYTKRVMNRIGFKEQTYEELQRLFMQSLPNSERLFNECHALLVELGKNICKKEPLCKKCPVNTDCRYYRNSGE
ncbi:endonuclease III domain-containing protein [Candidatus Woesearchaeota archaeon]|nr:endonuclease III domain-containing protein [Candidatus Woesearchaeota archaeon]